MADECGFGNHGTESPGACQGGHGDDHMNEQEDEVAHPGNGNNTSQAHLFRSVWQFAMDSIYWTLFRFLMDLQMESILQQNLEHQA